MFGYLDQQLSDYWGGRLYRLVQAVSFFDSFTLGLARVLTGDNQIERSLNRLLQISSFLSVENGVYAIRYPAYRDYLRRRAEADWSAQEKSALYANAGMYYQLTGDLPAALDCYARDGNYTKVSELLAEHSRLTPRPRRLLPAAGLLPPTAGERNPFLAGADERHEHPVFPDL